MNIFYLDECPKEAARMQCDRHVVKMILETAQLLSTAHHELDGESPAYKPTHKNHPSAVWVRERASNYLWAYKHMLALGREYEARYNKVHKTIAEHATALRKLPAALQYDCRELTEPPQCMPDEYKRDDATLAYQLYYNAKADDWDSRGMTMTWYGSTGE